MREEYAKFLPIRKDLGNRAANELRLYKSVLPMRENYAYFLPIRKFLEKMAANELRPYKNGLPLKKDSDNYLPIRKDLEKWAANELRSYIQKCLTNERENYAYFLPIRKDLEKRSANELRPYKNVLPMSRLSILPSLVPRKTTGSSGRLAMLSTSMGRLRLHPHSL